MSVVVLKCFLVFEMQYNSGSKLQPHITQMPSNLIDVKWSGIGMKRFITETKASHSHYLNMRHFS